MSVCRAALHHCGCRTAGFYQDRTKGSQLCSPFDMITCFLEKATEMQKFMDNYLKEVCKIPLCSEWIYGKSVSYANLNRNFILENFMKKNSIKKTDESFIGVTLFHGMLGYERIEERPSYDAFTLVSQIGGQMGLFLGASLITILQIFFYIGRNLQQKFSSGKIFNVNVGK